MSHISLIPMLYQFDFSTYLLLLIIFTQFLKCKQTAAALHNAKDS